MTWRYAIRERRLAEVYEGAGMLDGAYALLGWRDAPQVIRDAKWVVRDLWRYRGR